jgi:hypothetical protein
LFDPVEDTAPTDTLPAINAIINPINVVVDSNLLTPASGTRYLLTDDIGYDGNLDGSEVWNGLVAQSNDIIEYNGSTWVVLFDHANHNTVEYITNNNTGVQYRWTGSEWVKSVEGVYRGGDWSIVI